MRVIRLPRSSMNFADSKHQAPLVSKARETNKWVDVMVEFFVVLFAADYYYYYLLLLVLLFYFIFSPTSTEPVGLKIN